MPNAEARSEDGDPEASLRMFLDRFEPDIRDGASEAINKLRDITPGADVMIYDNYQALVLGVSPSDRPSDAIMSIVVYPRRYLLYFLQGAELADPDGLLEGRGKVGRSITLSSPDRMDDPQVAALIQRALAEAKVTIPPGRNGRVEVRYVSPKRRPRRL